MLDQFKLFLFWVVKFFRRIFKNYSVPFLLFYTTIYICIFFYINTFILKIYFILFSVIVILIFFVYLKELRSNNLWKKNNIYSWIYVANFCYYLFLSFLCLIFILDSFMFSLLPEFLQGILLVLFLNSPYYFFWVLVFFLIFLLYLLFIIFKKE